MASEWRKRIDKQKQRKRRAADPERVIANKLIREVRAIRKSGLTPAQQMQKLDNLITKRGAQLRALNQQLKER